MWEKSIVEETKNPRLHSHYFTDFFSFIVCTKFFRCDKECVDVL